ncbi:bifunctional [glutamine synthetase] adenylyltransferase/[glutamine synthetase]-adenylyl-L-tyrosine phosphorylase [Limibaculum sp. M0105]|uniref:Bifunctional [glutamine synthetase] adenylyltransferase/[glutamine synthetase]-adenylyl-L-tyrosine phosphorylase n=1 Tax=Thermohalobaculum xanthum TaxID=2753746 RepID=A0A8J7SG58_9RHOB|nr:bifunctional [glutamine synthetase] adenylyltransferase/[glutamine synthetase]-adenylyl-L-tyrosine phosphorylase [Thermohalobaculum xanthum]MBK0400621.1 bifunctional [glutamine synthetase] adenylyltransferase/[glutamine synthetase]-adenylyl-L-tyrosine phosphorylase [Thermohalobaculum xanthum]
MDRPSLAARVRTAPIPFEPDRATDLAARLPDALTRGVMGELIRGVTGSSPYLARLTERHAEWLAEAAAAPPEIAVPALLAEAREAAADGADQRSLATALRRAKGRAALMIALADLGGAWDLGAVTGALTDLADGLTETAAQWLLGQEIARGKLPGMTEASLVNGAGYVILAMGKHGARELNYSSDIDLICLFDQDQIAPDDFADAKARYIHVTRGLVKLLSEQTDDGYVFRTDLRLRPSPSTTPVCLALEAAERYYESVGRTWERAAHIKARPVAGDRMAGAAYLERLGPFIWRRHLDFAAIEDVEDLLRKIRDKKGRFTPSSVPGHDLKLGPGGIREIEFFAQTRQLIMGGREPALREPTTLGALSRLVEAGHVPQETATELAADYTAHRTLEHRLQMIEDAQTHTIPAPEPARARLAALAGWSDLAAFERDIAERLARVHETTRAFFAAPASTGAEPRHVEIDAEALARAGFRRPEDACRTLERWRSGRLAATRTERAQRLFAGLEARLVEYLAEAASPDDAIAEFDHFLTGLPAGVQVFSLFTANPHLLDLIVEICAAAPRLAAHLGREPQALDALIGGGFFEPLESEVALSTDLERWLGRESDYERQLDAARAWAREQVFRAGVQVLRGLADEVEAGTAFSAIAGATLDRLLPRVIADFATRHGPPPGRGMVVIGMGKLGTREMTAGSDLDLITVYDPGDAETSEGPRPLPPATYYPRLTQALVAALTVPTAQGRLYEVDMRLRPSGRQGPVAVSLATFRRYQLEDAWVWEHLALTRARVVTGPRDLGAETEAVIDEALARRKGDPAVLSEAVEMRSKLTDAHASARQSPWSLKHAAGGLMEIEFLAQTGCLYHGMGVAQPARALLAPLAVAGWIGEDEAEALGSALALQTRLQHVERVALEQPLDPDAAGEGLRRVLARVGGCEDFAMLAARLAELQLAAAVAVDRVFSEIEPPDEA